MFTILIHGSKLFSENIGIDTEHIIYAREGLYSSWDGIGRYGLIFLKNLLGQHIYNHFFAGILTILCLIGAVVAFGYLFSYVKGKPQDKEGILLFLFSAAVIAHPIMTEQIYFSLQSAEVALSFILCAVSLFLNHVWYEKKK